MRKSKRTLLKLAALFMGIAGLLCLCSNASHSGSLGQLASYFVFPGLFFTAWMLALVWRDHILSQSNSVRQVHADYHRPPETMSKGSRGLPTSFD